MSKNTNCTVRCKIESCVNCTPDHFCALDEIQVRALSGISCDGVTEGEQSMCADFRKKEIRLFR